MSYSAAPQARMLSDLSKFQKYATVALHHGFQEGATLVKYLRVP